MATKFLRVSKRTMNSNFSDFSLLIRSTFDTAVQQFSDKSIDLLHIDGRHFYDDVRHDFGSWRTKLSDRSVVIFHDINVREQNFGVWRLWEELKEVYPHFEFFHGHGLGVLGTGNAVPDSLASLFAASSVSRTSVSIRSGYARLGSAIGDRRSLTWLTGELRLVHSKLTQQLAAGEQLQSELAQQRTAGEQLQSELAQQRTAGEQLQSELAQQRTAGEQLQSELARQRTDGEQLQADLVRQKTAGEHLQAQLAQEIAAGIQLQTQLDQQRAASEQLQVEFTQRQEEWSHRAGDLGNSLAQLQLEKGQLTNHLYEARERADTLEQAVQMHRQQMHEIETSTAWLLTAPLRVAMRGTPRLRTAVRRSLKLVWWALTFQLISKLRTRWRSKNIGEIVTPQIKAPQLSEPPTPELPSAETPSPETPSPGWPGAEPESVTPKTAQLAHRSSRPRIIFISGEPETPGHKYRVKNIVSALAPRFFDVVIVRIDELPQAVREISGADIVWIWRARWTEELQVAIDAARAAGSKIVFDVDDLMFRPELAIPSIIDGIRSQGFSEVAVQQMHGLLQKTMSSGRPLRCAD